MPCDDSLDPLLRDLEDLRAELAEVEARVARLAAAQLRRSSAQPSGQTSRRQSYGGRCSFPPAAATR